MKIRARLTTKERAFAVKEGEHWDSRSLADVWNQTKPVQMQVDIQDTYLVLHLKPRMAAKLEKAATRRHVSIEKWLNEVVGRELANARR